VFFWDSTFLLLLPAMAFAIFAQYKVRSTLSRYSRVPAATGLTGASVAGGILKRNGLSVVGVRETAGTLSDHYDPRTQTVNLSTAVYRGRPLASLGVAAHEVGHAMQHGRGYLPLRIRHGMVPVANLGTSSAFPLFFIGLLFRGSILYGCGHRPVRRSRVVSCGYASGRAERVLQCTERAFPQRLPREGRGEGG
jgi:Zn-dependent membrane protease YugP